MEEVQMEEELWRQLPEELQLKLLDDHLPVTTQCRLRSVSRAWKTPRLRRGALHGLYIRKEKKSLPGIFLYDRKIGKSHTLLRRGFRDKLAGCVNGLLGAFIGTTKINPDGTKKRNLEMRDQVDFTIFNILCLRWTNLPPSPPAPDRKCVFAGMSRKPGTSAEPPRIGISNLEDYIVVVAMGNPWEGVSVPTTSMVLQVYNAGEWSSTLLHFPPAHFLMCFDVVEFKCGVLRDSVFYFLAMNSSKSAVSLCSVDVLSEDKQIKVLCGVDKAFVHRWYGRSMEHPKLAICSGKLLLVHLQVLPGSGEQTLGVQLLDEERVKWRFITSLPLDLKAASCCRRTIVICGGDELVIYFKGVGFIYNLVTNAWSTTSECLYPISYQ